MRGPFLPGIPSWIVLVVSLSVLALATFFLGGRTSPQSPPAVYEELRRRYETVSRLTMTIFIVGMVFGFVLGARLDYRRLDLGIGAGTGALAALCYLQVALSTNPKRSWRQYLQYQAMYRRYALPPIADIIVLLVLVVWGIVSALGIYLGT